MWMCVFENKKKAQDEFNRAQWLCSSYLMFFFSKLSKSWKIVRPTRHEEIKVVDRIFPLRSLLIFSTLWNSISGIHHFPRLFSHWLLRFSTVAWFLWTTKQMDLGKFEKLKGPDMKGTTRLKLERKTQSQSTHILKIGWN